MSAAPTPPVRARIIDVTAVALLLAVSMIPLWPIYEHPAVIWLGGIGLAVGVAVAIVGARWPGYAVLGLTVIAYALIGVPLAVPTRTFALVLPSFLGLRDLAAGTVTSWRQMLTAQIPFGTYQALLVPALIVVLGASVIGASIALRAKRAGWAALAPMAVLTFGILFGSDNVLWPLGTGVALVAIALLWATLRADPIRTLTGFAGSRRVLTPSTVRRYIAALVLVTACGAGALAVTSAWPTATHRDVLRNTVTPPFDVRDLLSPLVGYRNDVLPPGSEKVLFTATGLPEGIPIRLATLDTYNGMVFAVGSDPAVSGTFDRVPYRIDHAQGGTPAQVTITIDTLDGRWLPTVGDLVSIDFADDPELADRFYYNTSAAAGAFVSTLPKTAYTLNALMRPMPELESLASATPGPLRQPAIKAIPQQIVDAAHERGTGDTPGERLVALTQWLHSGYVSHSGPDELFSRSGHSAERLGLLVTEEPMLGDAEQYATAMALLAREVGFPSRVVVGYLPKADQTTITGADTTAWVEVQVADGRWVGLDPNPEPRPVPPNDNTTPNNASPPQSILPPPPPTDDEPVTTQNDDDERRDDPEPQPGWITVLFTVLRGVGLGVGVIAVLTLPIWVLALAAWIRRRRRRRRDQQHGVVTGGWEEIRDALIDRGHDIHPADTRQEVAALSGSPAVLALAERADRAVFSDEGFKPRDVGSYWSQVRVARRTLDKELTRRDRLRRLVTLKAARSLRHSWVSWRQAHGKAQP